MREETTFELIRAWAKKKGIYDQGDSKTQLVKLVEEQGELARAILKRDDDEFYDAIGDCVVVLTNIVELYEKERRQSIPGPVVTMGIEDCILQAYAVISNRVGKMINGTFVKDK